jgi:NADP-dependent 3-hydroxy acid dehydrogenase YdfG
MKTPLERKVAVVTGVTSGIGEAIASALLEEGASVVGVARDGAKLAGLGQRWGNRFSSVAVDLASPEDRRSALQRVKALAERPDVVVSNAAECVFDAPLAFDVDSFRRLFEVNVLAAIDLVQTLVPSMQPGGHLVQLSSVTARHLPAARFGPYATTKRAIESFVESLRLELHPRGIKVSLVVPGLVDTPIYDKVRGFAATRAKIEEQIPRWLDARDVADAVVWMLTRPAHVAVSEIVLMPREQPR